jgi:hypothetical protein
MYLLSVRNKGKLYVDVQSGIINSWHLCDTSLGFLYILLTVHPEAIVGFQPTRHTFFTFFKYLFFHLYMFQATSAHHQEGTIVSTHPLV